MTFPRCAWGAVLVAMAVGCGRGGDESANGPARVVYWRSLTAGAGEAQDELALRFNEAHTDVQVESEFQGDLNALATKLSTAAAAGAGPDVTMLGTFEIRTYAQDGLLVDLRPFLAGPNGMDTTGWPGTMRAAGEVDGGVYWLPFNVSVPVLYYNSDALKSANLAGPPQTWAEFYDCARRLTTRDNRGNVQRAGVALWDITWPYISIIWSEGGELCDKDYKNVSLNSPVAVEVMTELQRLVKEGAAILPSAASGGHRAAFMGGRAAMILDSPAPFDDIFAHAAGFAPEVAMFPAGKAGRVFAPGGAGIAMWAAGDEAKRDAAWEYMKYLLSPESLAYFAQRSGYLAFTEPARQAAENSMNDPRRKLMHDSLQYVRGDFSVNMSPAVRLAFDDAFRRIMVEGADPKEALDAADARAEKELAQR